MTSQIAISLYDQLVDEFEKKLIEGIPEGDMVTTFRTMQLLKEKLK